MMKFIKQHGYLLFVVLILGLLAGGYVYKQNLLNLPMIQVSQKQQQLVRHEKNENQLTAFEAYVDRKMSIHFTQAQVQTAAIYLVSACLVVLILQPIVVYLIYESHPTRRVKRQRGHHYNIVRIDRDVDPNYKSWS